MLRGQSLEHHPDYIDELSSLCMKQWAVQHSAFSFSIEEGGFFCWVRLWRSKNKRYDFCIPSFVLGQNVFWPFLAFVSIRYEIAKRNSLEEVNGRTMFRAAIVRSWPEKRIVLFSHNFGEKLSVFFFVRKKGHGRRSHQKCECSVKWPLKWLVPETLMNISWKSLSAVYLRIRLFLGFLPFLIHVTFFVCVKKGRKIFFLLPLF